MSAQRLRDAAKVLRERAEVATPGPWEPGRAEPDPYGMYSSPVFMPDAGCEMVEAEREDDATYIATMHPGVALALADWLMEAAEAFDDWAASANPTVAHWNVERGIKVADLILGAES